MILRICGSLMLLILIVGLFLSPLMSRMFPSWMYWDYNRGYLHFGPAIGFAACVIMWILAAACFIFQPWK